MWDPRRSDRPGASGTGVGAEGLRGAGFGGGAGGCYLPVHSFFPTSPMPPATFDLASRAHGKLPRAREETKRYPEARRRRHVGAGARDENLRRLAAWLSVGGAEVPQCSAGARRLPLGCQRPRRAHDLYMQRHYCCSVSLGYHCLFVGGTPRCFPRV